MITENIIRYNCKKFITYRFISRKDKIYTFYSDINNNNIGIF